MAEAPEMVTLSIKLSSGQFESSVTVPLDSSETVRKCAVANWLQMVLTALRNNVTEMRVVFDSEDRPDA